MDLKVSILKQARWVFDKAEIILGPNSSNEDIIFRAVFFNFFKLSSNMEFQSDNCAGLIAKNQFILRRLSAKYYKNWFFAWKEKFECEKLRRSFSDMIHRLVLFKAGCINSFTKFRFNLNSFLMQNLTV